MRSMPPVAESRRPANLIRIALLLFLAAFFLRVYRLDVAPPGLHFDEGANGVDTLRIWQGVTPLFFPANNGREPLYIYLLSLFVNVLGNNAFALRLPAAMAGTVAVASTFALGRRLLDDRAALIGAGFVAVTFWTVSLSRISYRANLFLALFPIFLLLLWRCRDRRRPAPVHRRRRAARPHAVHLRRPRASCRSWPSCCSLTGGARCAGAA